MVAANTPPDTYPVTYELCDISTTPTCATAVDNITVLADSDGDAIADINDLDDDNDGILDAIEAPSCYYTVAELGVISSVSTGLTISTGTSSLLHDGVVVTATPNFSFTAGQALANANIFTVTYPTPTNLTSMTIVNSTSMGTSSTAKLQGSVDGTTWLDLTSATTSLATTANKVFTVNQNSGDYTYYRVVGVAAATSLANAIFEITNVVNSTGYIPSLHAKATCQFDTDNDGIVNQLDLDSDGDGCPDAIEGGASFTTANLVTSTMAGGNIGGSFTGNYPSPVIKNLGNTVGNTTTTMGVPTIAGTGQTIGTSQNGAAQDAACPALDYDDDGISDATDLDDDNDGILDTQENCNLPNPANISNTNGALTAIATINGSTPTATKNGSTVVGAAGVSGISNVLYSTTLTLGNTLAQSPDYGTADLFFQSPVTNVAFGIDAMEFGSEYVNIQIMPPYTGTPTLKFFIPKQGGTITQLNATTWRVSSGVNCGNSGVCQSGGILEITGAFFQQVRFGGGSVAGWPSTNLTWNKNVTVSLQDAVVQGTCNEDTDGDGINNEFDLDADGDGCSDAIEGGAAFTAANLVTSTIAGGNSGPAYTGTSTMPVTQNLGNTVGNTATTMGVPTIAGTGQTIRTSQNVSINSCIDSDNDGIADVDDLDDDNDGILDTAENACSIATTGSPHLSWDMNSTAFPGTLETNNLNPAVLSSTSISNGAGIAFSASGLAWAISGATATNLAGAEIANDYLQFTLSTSALAASTYTLTQWTSYRSSLPFSNLGIRISTDPTFATSSLLYSGANSNTTGYYAVNLQTPYTLARGTTYYIRVYLFGNGNVFDSFQQIRMAMELLIVST